SFITLFMLTTATRVPGRAAADVGAAAGGWVADVWRIGGAPGGWAWARAAPVHVPNPTTAAATQARVLFTTWHSIAWVRGPFRGAASDRGRVGGRGRTTPPRSR